MKILKLINYNKDTDSMDDGSYIPSTPIMYGDTILNGYEDISSIINWDKSNHMDWARRRDEILPLFYAEAGAQLQNFAGMSAEKKSIACRYFLIPYSVRIQLISDSEDASNWDYLLHQTKLSRQSCIEAMRIKTGQYMRLGLLTLAQTQSFYKDVFQYINWFNDANAPDFKQWLTNEVGSPYEIDGFAQKSYFSTNLQTDLLSIYNGTY